MSEKVKPVAVVACMDEDLDYGKGVIVFGTAGSLITNVGGGNQEVYPDDKRELVARTRQVVFDGLQDVAEKMEVELKVTSHTGCGAGAAQDIKGVDELQKWTKAICDECGVNYVGHIPYADEPVEIDEAGFRAHIGRHEDDHHHGARRVIVTVGGGITEEEIRKIEADGYGDGFIVSADWIASVLLSKSSKMTEDDIIAWLTLHVDIADGIADGVARDSSVKIYDARRLEEDVVKLNKELVNKMLDRLKTA